MNLNWRDYIQKNFLYRKDEFIRIGNHTFSKQEIYQHIIEFSIKLQNKFGKERIPISLLGLSDIHFLIVFFGTLCSGQIPLLSGNPSNISHIFHASIHFTDDKALPKLDTSILNFKGGSSKENSFIFSHSDFFIQSSGTMDAPKWIGLNLENLSHSLALHKEKINIKNCNTISVLPYHHIFGLVLDLFLSLEFHNNIIRPSSTDWDCSRLCLSISLEDEIYFCGVPKIFEMIVESGNQELLRKCRSGIVGGARISSFLAENLMGSNFHVGYGQTEACPGILMGDRGEFFESYLGREIGVSVRINEEGTLAFQGKNAFTERFEKNQILKLSPDRWVDSGDLVEKRGEQYFYRGRLGYSFKISNGRWIIPEEVEEEMRTRTNGLPPFFLAEHPRGGIEIFIQSGDTRSRELLKKSLPSYLVTEKIWLQTPGEWSKDRKGNPDRKAMQKLKSRKPGTLL